LLIKLLTYIQAVARFTVAVARVTVAVARVTVAIADQLHCMAHIV
jgi:hypothetical protein